MDIENEVAILATELTDVRNILIALGDETRLHIILEMMKIGCCSGARVGEITEKTNLSRPAVSHHLQILKNAGIINVRHEGTKNYYYFDTDARSMDSLLETILKVKNILAQLPNRRNEE